MSSPPLNYTVAGTRTFPKGNHLRKQLLDNLLSSTYIVPQPDKNVKFFSMFFLKKYKIMVAGVGVEPTETGL